MQEITKANILIVDDEKNLTSILSEEFSDIGLQNKCVNSGRAAIEAITNDETINVVISDIKMPDGDGVYLLSELKKIKASELPIFIFMTGQSKITTEECLSLGATAVFPKPINYEALITSVIQEIKYKFGAYPTRKRRFTTSHKVQYSTKKCSTFIESKLKNISLTGMNVVASTASDISIGDQLNINYNYQTNSKQHSLKLNINAKVIWNSKYDNNKTRLGLKFCEITEKKQFLIYSIINDLYINREE